MYEQKSIQWSYEDRKLIYQRNSYNKSDLHALQWTREYKLKADALVDVLILKKEEEASEENKLANFGIQRCFRIPSNGSEKEDAAFISDLLKNESYSLILSGYETEDEHSCALLPLLSYELGIGVLTAVYQLEGKPNGQLTALRKEERGSLQEFTIQLPAAVSVTSHISKLRYHRGRSAPDFTMIEVKRQLSKPEAVRRIEAPEPNIWYADTPSEEIPQLRLLNIMGFASQSNNSNNLQKQTDHLSKAHLYFTAERLVKWLKE